MKRSYDWLVAAGTAVLTVLTFAISFATPPYSGPLCEAAGCLAYPFTDAASRFPRDYYFMLPVSLLSILVIVLMLVLARRAGPERAVSAGLAIVAAAISATVLLVNNYLQFAVVQASLLAGESEGIAILTQFNPHGIFIALDELGYLMLALALAAAAGLPERLGAAARVSRWAFGLSLPLSAIAFVAVSLTAGLQREYYFELAVISIAWLSLAIGAGALALAFRPKSAT